MTKKDGMTVVEKTGCGKLYTTLNCANDKCKEKQFFARIGRSGTCARASISAQMALVEVALKNGVSIEEIADALSGIKCHQSNDATGTRSCPDALAKSLIELGTL